jgi:hypothetical protein
MTHGRFTRVFTSLPGRYPTKYRVVPEEVIPDAYGKIKEHFREIKKQVPRELMVLLDVRFEKGDYNRSCHFGGNSVTQNDFGSDSLVFDAGSKQALEYLLRVADLKRFEPKKSSKKRR